MDPTRVFSTKAALYARYRWDYAPLAIQTIVEATGISGVSCVADIGAGTGILAARLAGRVGRLYAVEPNAAMRQMATQALASYASCRVVDGRAEATGLPNGSVDLITAAQSIHWFEPGHTMHEFARILRPGGWLAILRNYGTDRELGAAIGRIFDGHEDADTEALMVGRGTPASSYYGGAPFLVETFPFTTRRDWDGFIGSLSTTSSAPDEGSSSYARFARAARCVFDQFAHDGILESGAATELYLGQPALR
ncbi:MAG: class I SAM-dependent methyltransferase [Anaerolineae bacterium]